MDTRAHARTALRLSLPGSLPPPPSLDPVQQRAVDWPNRAGNVLVVGAPGTGKTTTAVAALLHRARDLPATAPARAAGGNQGVLMLVPTRRGAGRVRDAVTARLGRTTTQVLVRTPASFAYSVLRLRAVLLGQPAPTLITGPDQDQVLAELLAGHRAGLGAPVRWPAAIGTETLALGAFRDELRDLFMRAAELGLGPEELAERGQRYDRPEWVAAAVLLREYQEVTALGEMTPDRGARLDAARIVDEATAALRAWEQEVPGHPRPRWSAVVVDDHQDSTLATARLLRVLADDGAQLLLHGDPDAGVQGFRGGSPALVGLAESADPLGGFAATRLVLPTVHRGDAELRRAATTVTGAISTVGTAAHRRAGVPSPDPAEDGGSTAPATDSPASVAAAAAPAPRGVQNVVLRSRAQEGAYLARTLREEHLHHGTPWSRMAVIVRSSGDLTGFQRMLRSWGVPVGAATAAGVLREEPAARPLLTALRACLTGRTDAEQAVELLTSPLGALDAVALRGLRRALRGAERAAGGTRPVDELLVEAVEDPAVAAALPPHVRRGPARVAAVLAAGRTALEDAGATAETVLWALWSTSGLAEPWRDRALAGGPGAERADADLDAVMALFKAAEWYTDRTLGGGPAGFLDHVSAQDLPADSLAARGVRTESVQVLTPAAAAGEEWEVVVVAGLQEDVWPDLRLRDSLLGAGALADVEAGRSPDGRRAFGPARRQVLDDELRMLAVAVTRPTRRLLITAVLDEDARPSSFFDLLAPDGTETTDLVRTAPPALDLRGLVAELRCALEPVSAGAPDRRRDIAAALLAHLAGQDVAGADPEGWAGLADLSTDVPLRPPGAPVPVSPSSVEQATGCGLRWALEQAGGRGERSMDQSVGSLVHEIAAEHPHGTAEQLHAALDARWSELGLGDAWTGRRQRQLAGAMVDRLAAYLAGVPGQVDVEREFTADVGRAHLTGRMDRVEHLDDGLVRVVDLKTSASPVSAEKAAAHPQLGAYQAAVDAGAFGEPAASAGGRLVYLGTGKSATERAQPALATAEDPAWAARLVTEAAETMAGTTFVARLGEACQHCPVRASCPLQDNGGRVTTR
ncbi:ATP-dependent helicase [Georgenia yuyongxinii]|uniref:DNA 3'-5' helicase n=1 Tax=Georgenia yuyongxinii TaxID=2589797 RepID=A0A5B8C3J2_9MICO|nr:ATP-dependent helicase [Georgenia yuyongxinii]